jgi:Fur family ferric uptake transcriptional regulator
MPAAAGREERRALTAYLVRNRLKRSAQREAILDAFVKAGHHVSVEDLLEIVRRRHPEVGRTTIYRTLKLFKDAGLASELLFGDEARFEPVWNRDHHDHFVCVACGAIFEFQSPEIERLQEEIASGIGFKVEGHRHHVFGRCRKCASKPLRPARAR